MSDGYLVTPVSVCISFASEYSPRGQYPNLHYANLALVYRHNLMQGMVCKQKKLNYLGGFVTYFTQIHALIQGAINEEKNIWVRNITSNMLEGVECPLDTKRILSVGKIVVGDFVCDLNIPSLERIATVE